MSTLTRTLPPRPGIAPPPPVASATPLPRPLERLRDGAVPPAPPGRLATEDGDEALVADPRASLTPSQMVERKLLTLLDGRALPVSHVQMVVLPRVRRGK